MRGRVSSKLVQDVAPTFLEVRFMQSIPGTNPAAFLSYALVTELIDTLVSQGVMSRVGVNNMLRRILSTIGTMNRGPSSEAADILRQWIKRIPAD
jgi:hypothetical protein